MGGEKPMDFAYLNAVLKSSYFPPFDPWFAGGYINYYYFGFVLIGAPIKALGIDPAIAYNLAVPTLFGLTACGAFGLGASFYAWRAEPPGSAPSPAQSGRAILAGVLAAVFVVGIGNWGQPDVIFPAWQKLGGIEDGTPALVATLNGILKWAQGQPLPIYPNWPYWNPTRLHEAVPIAEFPQFTFLYADLHAHMIAMPLAYLAVALALALAGSARRWLTVGMAALVVGALWPTNSWDYPVYLLLTLAAIAIGAWQETGRAGDAGRGAFARAMLKALPAMIVFVVLTRAFYVPYLENYGSAYNQIDRWQAETTPLAVYRTIYGVFLIPLIVYFAWSIWATLRRAPQQTWGRWIAVSVVIAGATAAVALALAAQNAPVAVIAVPMMALAALAAVMPGTAGPTRALWQMTAGAFALTVFVELFTLRGDIGRMNTVFKFYIQAWLLLSVSAPVACVWQIERMSEPAADAPTEAPARRPLSLTILKGAFVAGMVVSLLVAGMYPAFAIPAKINDRYTRAAPQGLDGMAYMRYAERFEGIGGKERTFPLRYDYEAIRWMQDHVDGSPIIIEGTTGGNLYRWGNRFSIYTGLPAVVGWQWHQRQQRAALSDRIVYDRDDDLTEFYNTPDIGRALTLIRRYHAAYIILGDLERVYYNEAGFGKFDEMVQLGYLSIAYRNEGTTVFKVER
jgi:YYY domain-containing protein